MKPVYTSLRNYLLAGLAFAIPLVATIWLMVFTYKAFDTISRPIVRVLLPQSLEPPSWLQNITCVFLVLGIIIGLGFMTRNVIGKQILITIDRGFGHIPLVAFVYNGLKQITASFQSMGTEQRFKRVVYLDYITPGARLIGFVTSQYYDTTFRRGMTCVFIPTSPNPMTGFVLVVDDDKVVESDLTLEQASKLIISAGLVSPSENLPPR